VRTADCRNAFVLVSDQLRHFAALDAIPRRKVPLRVRQQAAHASRRSDLAEAMRSRAVIAQAKGMLMSDERISAEEAFDKLVGGTSRPVSVGVSPGGGDASRCVSASRIRRFV
jgi:hypothetical protein